MATYGITGVWKDAKGVITHYAFHLKDATDGTYGRADKKTKAQAVALVEATVNSAHTLVWNYTTAGFRTGEQISVVGNGTNKYLRSDPDNKLTDNLAHLIDFDWIAPA